MMETIKGIRTAEGVAQIDYDVLSNKPVIVNPNLLDNWYFGNPVNQRGQTEYTAQGYSIDRWYIKSNATKITLLTDGIKMGKAISNGYAMFSQYVEDIIEGSPLTLSAICEDKLGVATSGENWTYPTEGETNIAVKYLQVLSGANIAIIAAAQSNGLVRVAFYFGGSLDVTLAQTILKAVKLELGDVQTLAHQNDSGNWILNEIPNYADQLARCQRYFQVFRTETERKTYCEDFRPTMRTTDRGEVAKSTITINGVTYYTATADL